MDAESDGSFESNLDPVQRRMRWASACALLVATLAASAAAETGYPPNYPPSLDPDAVGAWLRQATEVAPEQVVALSASAATAVVAQSSTGGGLAAVQLRAQALTPDAAARSGVLAWEMRLEVDCRSGRVRAGETTGFPARRPDENGVPLAPADISWRRPNPGTALQNAWRSVCEAGFTPPLGAPGQRVATVATVEDILPELRPALPAPVPTVALRTVIAAREPPGHASAQVVAASNEADTRGAVAALRHRFAGLFGDRETRVELAQVRGRTIYRGVVTGFESRTRASVFCDTLKRNGQDCLVR